jgi:hypothetical protein
MTPSMDFNLPLKITLNSFQKELAKLDPDDFLPRFNKIVLTIENESTRTIDDLLLTVTRTGSKIGPDNYDVVPIKAYQLKPRETGKYEIMVFDPFNEEFETMEVRLTTTEDCNKRKKVDNWLKKAGRFSRRLDKNGPEK